MKNPTYQIVQRSFTKRVDIMRKLFTDGREWHHVATCESIETARTLVNLMNTGLAASLPETTKPTAKKRRAAYAPTRK